MITLLSTAIIRNITITSFNTAVADNGHHGVQFKFREIGRVSLILSKCRSKSQKLIFYFQLTVPPYSDKVRFFNQSEHAFLSNLTTFVLNYEFRTKVIKFLGVFGKYLNLGHSYDIREHLRFHVPFRLRVVLSADNPLL